MVLELGMLLRCFCDALVMLFDAFAMLFWRSCDALGKLLDAFRCFEDAFEMPLRMPLDTFAMLF